MSEPKSGRLDIAVANEEAARKEAARVAAFHSEQRRIRALPHKSVNGVLVQITADEHATLRAEWEAADIEAAKHRPPSLADRVATLETQVAALAARATK